MARVRKTVQLNKWKKEFFFVLDANCFFFFVRSIKINANKAAKQALPKTIEEIFNPGAKRTKKGINPNKIEPKIICKEPLFFIL